jgi:hypothetical protein
LIISLLRFSVAVGSGLGRTFGLSAPIRGHAGGLASTNYRGVHRQRPRDKPAGALSSRHGVAPAQSSQLDWGQRGGPILQGCAMPRFKHFPFFLFIHFRVFFSRRLCASCLGSRTYGQLGKLQRECHPASVKIPAVPFPPFEENGGVVDVNVNGIQPPKAPRTRRGSKKRTKANSPRFKSIRTLVYYETWPVCLHFSPVGQLTVWNNRLIPCADMAPCAGPRQGRASTKYGGVRR